MKRTLFLGFFVFSLFFDMALIPMLSSAQLDDPYRPPFYTHAMDKVENWVAIFEDPKRDEWQKPDEIIKTMNLKQGDVVVDIGAGSGYFTRRFAKAVGPTGKAFALDIEPGLVKYMQEDASRLNLKNYIPRLVKKDDPGLEPNSVDVIFFSITYHYIEDRVNYMRRLLKVLKKGGRVIFVEFYIKKMDFGPPPGDKDAKETVIKEMEEAGYRLTRYLDFLRYQYFLEFEPAT